MILGPEETDTVEKLTIMTFVNEVMQFLQKDSTYPSQPGRRFLCSQGFRQGLPETKRSQGVNRGLANVSVLTLGRYFVINVKYWTK